MGCMPESISHNAGFVFLKKVQHLFRLKLMTVRSGLWFRALSRIDRALVDVTIKVAGNIRSSTLAKGILAVMNKLEGPLESRLVRAVREKGFPIAQRLSVIAQEWGNVAAKDWSRDGCFARFSAVKALNNIGFSRGSLL